MNFNQIGTYNELKRELIRILRDIEPAFAEWECREIISHVFGLSATDLIIQSEKTPPKDKVDQVQNILRQRRNGEPLDHILGFREFYGRRFEISKHVLSPRGDTEILIEAVLQQIPEDAPANILDLGTGSGAIAITIAAECPLVRAIATDISPKAIETARRNALMLGVDKQIEFRQGSWFDPVQEQEKFDVIMSNPPYISEKAYSELSDEVRSYDPKIALHGGEDGLSAYRLILEQVPRFLKSGGMIIFEIGFDQGVSVSDLCHSAGFDPIKVRKDLSGHDRVVLAHKS